MSAIYIQKYSSPCGDLMLGEFENKLCLCDWVVPVHLEENILRLKKILKTQTIEEAKTVTNFAAGQLDEYFKKQRKTFDVPIAFIGTDFQIRVWKELQKVPYGQTLSYAGLAEKAGNRKAVRAVANVNAINPISIFLPCHRIIGSNGKLTGYGGGLAAKKYLLDLEGGNLF